MNDSIPETFLQSVSVEIVPHLNTSLQAEWMTSTLLLLLIGMVILWFVIPDRKSLIYSWMHPFEKPNKTYVRRPGFMFPFLFYLNYLFAIILFLILAFERFLPDEFMDFSQSQFVTLITIAFVGYSLYKLAFIAFIGTLFKTWNVTTQQIRLYVNQNSSSGFFMLLILFFILFTNSVYFFYLGFLMLIISNVIKWFQTIALEKIISTYKLYHLIIYLCTLEILPMILLIRIVRDLSN